MKYLIFIFSLLFVQLSIWSQFRPQNGVMKSTGDYTAIVNAHIYISSSEEINHPGKLGDREREFLSDAAFESVAAVSVDEC